MICRIWHGWTTRENADAYEHLLRSEIFHGIADRRIPGYRFDDHSAHYEVRQPRAMP